MRWLLVTCVWMGVTLGHPVSANPMGELTAAELAVGELAVDKPAVSELTVGELTVDGVRPGLTYSEVLTLRGRPLAVHEKRGLAALTFPAPAHRKPGTDVWFSEGKVVYGSGYTLLEDGEPLHLYGLPGRVLIERFGPVTPLTVFASWWSNSGVVLAGSNHLFPEDELRAPIGLRSLDFPLRWVKASNGISYSESEPWVDDERISWMAEDVELGMPQERAQNLAGHLDIVYQGGFVQAIRQPLEAILVHRVGHHDFSVTFEVGAAPQFFGSHPLRLAPPDDGWYCPAPSGRIRMERGKVAEIHLELDFPELFAALEKLMRQ